MATPIACGTHPISQLIVVVVLKIANRGYVIENGIMVLRGESKDLLNNDAIRKAYIGA